MKNSFNGKSLRNKNSNSVLFTSDLNEINIIKNCENQKYKLNTIYSSRELLIINNNCKLKTSAWNLCDSINLFVVRFFSE